MTHVIKNKEIKIDYVKIKNYFHNAIVINVND